MIRSYRWYTICAIGFQSIFPFLLRQFYIEAVIKHEVCIVCFAAINKLYFADIFQFRDFIGNSGKIVPF